MRKLFKVSLVVLMVAFMLSQPAGASSVSVRFNSDNHGNYKHRNHRHPNYGHQHYYSYPHYWPYYSVSYSIYSPPPPVVQYVYVQPYYYPPAPQPVQQIIFADNAPSYQNDNGQYCREYNALIYVGGKKQSGYGTACYQPDGSWKIVD